MERLEYMAIGFTDPEKACDTMPREMAMATLRWMRVPEAEAGWLKGRMKTQRAGCCVDRKCQESLN